MLRIIKTGVINFINASFTCSREMQPLFPLYHITPFCNLKCSYCDGLLEKKKNSISQLNTNEVKKVIKILRQKFDYIFITGGEPFIRDDIVEILKYTKKLKFKKIAINTNSILLPEKEDSGGRGYYPQAQVAC